MQSTISEILRDKGNWVLTIGPDATVFDAISEMESKRVGAIVVLDDSGNMKGIFTERDYLRRIVLRGRTSKTTKMSEVMTEKVFCVTPSYTVGECMATMTDKKLRHLPVVDEGNLVGIISIGDCVKKISQEAQAQVKFLTDYVTGRYPA
ncbi:MAG: CBS domain-containing protein [Rhodothermales bacterium]|nr:CBS domain-containing protein [Rhodothermales bacterium]